ncbi:hypothetical protein ACFV42_23175 [Streptomyces solisilvae]|uniref:hypothetical protein n=1 Tax=Streptomyces malaysiensis TaxID=92644 RepID=UPI0036763667
MTRTSKNTPVRYYGGFDIYRIAGIRRDTFEKLAAGPWCPRPDIYIGVQPGWKPSRAMRWLKETGRIDIHGRPARADRRGRPRRDEEPPGWYCPRTAPKRYSTAEETARLLNHEKKIIGRMKAAGHGPEAAVVIGDLEGYSIDEVVRLGEQYGWIEQGGAEVRARWAEMCDYRRRSLKRSRTAKTKARKKAGASAAA